VRDIDATLVDARGQSVAHDTTNEPQAVMRACVENADAYLLVIKVTAGAGPWVMATWEGGVGAVAAAGTPSAPAVQQAAGTCEAPIPLQPGTVTGTTTHGENASTGSCERSDAREIVYELDVAQRQRVTIEVEAHFDSVIYVRKDDCTDENAEVDCNDDAPGGGRNKSRIEHVLEPGKYFVFVDGYNQEAGSYKLTLTTSDVVALSDACRRAPLLAAGAAATSTTEGSADDAEASCGGGAEGADAPWRVELAARSRLRVVEHSDDVSPVVHLRRACTDEQSEVGCGESGASTGDAAVTGIFEPGAYTVFADARERESAGRYQLRLDTAPPGGGGTTGDGCGDALPLVGASGAVSGDTFAARDDLSASCGGAGAPDVAYRVDVARRSRLVATLQGEEGSHLLAAWRRCGDRASELACGRALDDVLAPGTYFLGVDGAAPDAFGRFTLSWALQDLTAQGGACAAAPALVEHRATGATTVGAGDKFTVSCAGGDSGASGPDRVFRFSLRTRATVRVTATASTFDAAVALRKACGDTSGGLAAAELACEAESDAGHRTSVERALEPGTYWVVVDGQTPNDQGPFTVDYQIVR
jgi:hypothetical protein